MGWSVADFITLAKPRITALVTLTGVVGYIMGSQNGVNVLGMIHVMVSISLVAAAANTLNQIFERVPDGKMKRTLNRPLPAGRLRANQAATFAGILAMVGFTYAAVFVNGLTALLAVLTLVSYSLVYTPLKRITPFNTLVGAVPGALPPLGGWAAASGTLTSEAWVLFGILFMWQVPHFLAIAYLFKDDYANAGFRMLPVVDTTGRNTAVHLLGTALALLGISMLPSVLGMSGTAYLMGAVVLSATYLILSIRLAFWPSKVSARLVFIFSLVYLPVLLVLMTTDQIS
jgi:protoheme IX farnesyltransferase